MAPLRVQLATVHGWCADLLQHTATSVRCSLKTPSMRRARSGSGACSASSSCTPWPRTPRRASAGTTRCRRSPMRSPSTPRTTCRSARRESGATGRVGRGARQGEAAPLLLLRCCEGRVGCCCEGCCCEGCCAKAAAAAAKAAAAAAAVASPGCRRGARVAGEVSSSDSVARALRLLFFCPRSNFT